MPQYKHRGYSISISIERFDDKVKVATEILLPPEAIADACDILRSS